MNTRQQHNPVAHRSACFLLCACLMAGGCAKRYTDFNTFVTDHPPLVTSTEYRLAPPDTILITSKRVREINGHTETIRPDGKITLPLLGSIFVAGRTVEEVSAELSSMSRAYYDDAQVTMRVVAYNSKKIFVFGEVSAPGAYPYNGANTVLATMARAQPSRLADPQHIQVLRPNPDGTMRKKMTVDLNKMVREGDTTLNAVLEEGDILYVPPNPLASVGLALQQVLLPIMPAASVVKGPSDISSELTNPNYGQDRNYSR